MTGHATSADPFVRAFDAGEQARYAGLSRRDNPHDATGAYRARQGWDAGFEYGTERMGWSVAQKVGAE